MIIPAKVNKIKLNEPIDPRGCQLSIFSNGNPEQVPGSYAIIIHQISLGMINAKMIDTYKCPREFAIGWNAKDNSWYIFFNCKTDKEYYAQFRFNPPIKII